MRLSLMKSMKRAMFSSRTPAGVPLPRTLTPCRAVSASWALDWAVEMIDWYQTSLSAT
jgi:hypothetical protein